MQGMSEGQGRAPQGAAAGTLYHETYVFLRCSFLIFAFISQKFFLVLEK